MGRYQRQEERRQTPGLTGSERQGTERRRPTHIPTPLFQGADEIAILQAIGACEVLPLEPGETLLAPGEVNTTVYLLLSGELGVFLDADSTAEQAIRIAPGELLGELSAIDGKPVSALVKAISAVRVLKVPETTFWNDLLSVPGVARNLLRLLAARMRRNTESLLQAQRRQIELDHLRQELDVARQLQTGMLPLRQPMFPDRTDLDVCGHMDVASAVGGDLFDAFFVEQDRLFFCIGDVSGHGIAAAMFMARTVSLIRVHAFRIAQPDELLSRLNEELCEGNDANLFVSLMCGVLDPSTGELVYANAGHLQPAWVRQGAVSQLPLPPGPIAGVFPRVEYRSMTVTLAPGDVLLCYTDGLTEAHNASGQEFSEQRLCEQVQQHAAGGLESLLRAVRLSVAQFTARPDLDDDATMLALRRKGH